MSWLSDLGGYASKQWGMGGPFGATTKAIGRNRNVIGDVVKYGSDIVAPFTGPFAPLVAGAGNAIGTGVHEGTNFGDIAKSGAIGAGTGYLGQQLGAAFGAGSGTGAGAATGPDSVTMDSLGFSDLAGDAAQGASPGAAQVGSALAKNAPSSLGDQTWNAVKGIGSWAAAHPETVGQGLTAISQGPVNAATARRMALLNEQTDYDTQRQKARDQALSPIWQALASQAQGYMQRPAAAVAKNPYSR